MTSISVVIPAYNGAAFLGEALASVFAQTLRPCEVVVVDDGSTDDTAECVETATRSAPVPVRFLRRKANSGGPARPLNEGIAVAQGDLIAVLDQDDLFAPTKLATQAEVLAQDEELTCVCSYGGWTHDRGATLLSAEVARALSDVGEKHVNFWRYEGRQAFRLLLKHGNFAMGYPGFLFRRRDWERKRGLDERLRISSDYDLLCWLSLHGAVGLVPAVLYYRREHKANLCKRGTDVYLDTLRVKAKYLARERWLLLDKEFSQELRDQLFGLAYWLRESGRPWEALRCHVLISRLWGLDGRTLLALAKLVPCGLHRLFRRRAIGPSS